MATMKKTTKKPVKGEIATPSILNRIYTSFDQVTDAYNEVRDDLIKLGVLWRGSKLDTVECLYERIAPIAALKGWMGYFDFEDRDIHFPSVYLPVGWLTGSVGEKNSAPDVIRHEFGHALADRYPLALKKGGLFREAFGRAYSDKPAPDIDPDNWKFDFVSAYAATATREDFAETFMFFVKHKGKMPAKFAKKPAIVKKWKSVAEIVKRVGAATT